MQMKGLWLLLPLADAAMRRALVVVDMTVEQARFRHFFIRAWACCDSISEQVANISYRKKEVISTIRNLAQNGQFVAWPTVDTWQVTCARRSPVPFATKDALIDSHLWFEKGLRVDSHMAMSAEHP